MDRSATYDLANPKHRRELDGLSIDAIVDIFGEPAITPDWDMPRLLHWQPGQPRPLFADDDPAVMQAVGRCATARVFGRVGGHPEMLGAVVTEAHPVECGWCDQPLDMLLAACDWATFEGRAQTGEWLTWTQHRDGAVYQRRLPVDRRNSRHADFWSLAPSQRAERIEQALR